MARRRGWTAITERGLPASRNLSIHWAQESFDQAGLVREFVKWDYKLRRGDQLETVVDRALAMACPTAPWSAPWATAATSSGRPQRQFLCPAL